MSSAGDKSDQKRVTLYVNTGYGNDGNGAAHGVQLDQSTVNGPRKTVWIADQVAADWLIEQAAERGVLLEVVFT